MYKYKQKSFEGNRNLKIERVEDVFRIFEVLTYYLQSWCLKRWEDMLMKNMTV